MPYLDVEAAKKAGFSDQQIAEHMQKRGLQPLSSRTTVSEKAGKQAPQTGAKGPERLIFDSLLAGISPGLLAMRTPKVREDLPALGAGLGGFLGPLGAGLGTSIGISGQEMGRRMENIYPTDVLNAAKNPQIGNIIQNQVRQSGPELTKFAGRQMVEPATSALLDKIIGGAFSAGGKMLGSAGKLPLFKSASTYVDDYLKPMARRLGGQMDELLGQMSQGSVSINDILKGLKDMRAKQMVQTSGPSVKSEATEEVMRRLQKPSITSILNEGLDPKVARQIRTGLGDKIFSPATGQELNLSISPAGKYAGGELKKELLNVAKRELGEEGAEQLTKLLKQQADIANLTRGLERYPYRPTILSGLLGGSAGTAMGISGVNPLLSMGVGLGGSLAGAPYFRLLARQLLGQGIQGLTQPAMRYLAQKGVQEIFEMLRND